MMNKDKRTAILEAKTFEDLLNAEYGPIGTPERDEYDRQSQEFRIAEILKEERKKAGLTQEELAARIGTKKSYISRIENGKSDVQLSTLYRIFEGLGKRVALSIL